MLQISTLIILITPIRLLHTQTEFTTMPDSKPHRSVTFLLSALLPIAAAVFIYRLDSFDPAPMPVHELSPNPLTTPLRNDHMLKGSEIVGSGALLGPEDVAFDGESGVVYTGCADGWIKRVTVNDSVVESLVNTGGRPLGLAVGAHGEIIVADAVKGLLKVAGDGAVEVLTDEAEGVKFKLTDAVDIAHNGIIYFTDASYKYSLEDNIFDILEGRPHGRVMSFDPTTKETKVLVRDLYFANGIAVSPDQTYLVYCETPMLRCKKYYIEGEKKGSVDNFIDHLPGLPDNIRYDGDGRYWIALATEASLWELALKYQFMRKVMAMMERFKVRPHTEKNSGILAVDLEGKPTAHYYDPALAFLTSGTKIGDHLYCGSILYPYIIRLNLALYPAL